jgi:hypothetical protein
MTDRSPTAILEALYEPTRAACEAIGEARGRADAPALLTHLTSAQVVALIELARLPGYVAGDLMRALPEHVRGHARFAAPGSTGHWLAFQAALAGMLLTGADRAYLYDAGYSNDDVLTTVRAPAWTGLTGGWERAVSAVFATATAGAVTAAA